FDQKKRTTAFDVNPLALILKSKHLTYLALIIGISVLVAKLVDYQFSAIASAKIDNPDDLTAFFGFWFSSFNLISLAIQLFVTRKVVGVFGVGTSLFFLPFGIMMGALLVFVFPELWAVIILKLIDGSLKQSVNKSATELMALPIPLEIRNQTKSFIDVFVDSVATGIGGLILIFLVTGLDLSTRFISLMILALFFVWIYFARKIRLEYIRSFKSKIEQVKDHQERKTEIDFTNESVLSGLSRVLRQGSEKQILFILGKVKEMPNPYLFDDVRLLLDHQSAVVRAEALRCLYFFRNQSLNDVVLPMIQDSDQQVKSAAFEYLIAHSPENRLELLDQYLNDKDYRVRGAALLSLAFEARDNPDLSMYFGLENRVQKKIQSLPKLKDADEIKFRKTIILKTIAQSKLTGYYPLIDQLMADEDKDVVKQAIIAAGQTLSPDYINEIAGFLDQEQYKDSARAALIQYGPAIIDSFSAIIANKSWSTALMLHIPAIATKIGTQQSVELLFSLLDHSDIGLRMEALRALNTLKINHSNLGFHHKEVIRRVLDEAHLYMETLQALYTQNTANTIGNKPGEILQNQEQHAARKSLIALLERRLDGNLERIFRLLGLKYPPDDILIIYQSLQSKKPDKRINAIEFLDNLLEQNLKRVLIPIVETAMLDNISANTIKNLNLEITSEFQCLSMLLAGKDLRITLAALYLIARLDNKKYLPLVKQYQAHSNPKIRQFAAEAIDKLSEI
ncbi:MAG: HEAT repeat domain-containing protein, partial [Bacteroidales bacterium]|nr:HEAT repeat domain-containing protein [Bacteroidales bacterium]